MYVIAANDDMEWKYMTDYLIDVLIKYSRNFETNMPPHYLFSFNFILASSMLQQRAIAYYTWLLTIMMVGKTT